MSRAVFAVVFAGTLAAALAFRLADPDARPMHHDEANQAVRFAHLLETGEYRYDPHDHHGPTLYYLTLPVAWARGQHTLAALDERTLRTVPGVFGAATLALFLLLVPGLGRGAVAAAAALAAVSPALTYYSRFYIQEPLFVFFSLGCLLAAGRYVQRPGGGSALAAGLMAGLALATKETALIVLPLAVAACVLAARLSTPREGGAAPAASGRHAAIAIAGAAVPLVLFFSAFLTDPGGLLAPLRALPIYTARGTGPGPHAQPWPYYLQTLAWSRAGGLTWSEALVLGLAGTGIVYALAGRERAYWPACLALFTIATTVVYSALPYKTPWNLLPFYTGMTLMAGIGAAVLVTRARPAGARLALAVVLAAATWQLGLQNVRASFHYPADERNPFAYAQTLRDYLRLDARVRDLAAAHPDGRDMLVKVVAGPHEQWPFPWFAREMRRVGYWTDAAAAGALDGVPVILASQETSPAVEAALGEGYVTEFFGLRPGVLLSLHVEPELWQRFLDSRRSPQPGP